MLCDDRTCANAPHRLSASTVAPPQEFLRDPHVAAARGDSASLRALAADGVSVDDADEARRTCGRTRARTELDPHADSRRGGESLSD